MPYPDFNGGVPPMTTIAFDGKSIAADRGCWSNGLWTEIQKLHHVELPMENLWYRICPRVEGDLETVKAVVGLAGDVGLFPVVLTWLEKPDFIEGDALASDVISGLVVFKETGDAYIMEGTNGLVRIEKFPFAIGTGAEIAVGAMLAGASAKDAILIAAQRTSYSIGGVDVFTIEKDGSK